MLGYNRAEHFIAASGDNIYAEGNGQGVLPETPGVCTITESYAVTGGTGQFAGGSRSYVVHRTVELAIGATWGSFDGTIVVP